MDLLGDASLSDWGFETGDGPLTAVLDDAGTFDETAGLGEVDFIIDGALNEDEPTVRFGFGKWTDSVA